MKVLTLIWESLRPNQWLKNYFLFAGLIFSKNIFSFHLLVREIIAVILFCLLSGSLYIINDIIDIEHDKHHPIKSRRPLASGRLKISSVLLFLIIVIPLSIGVSFYLNFKFFVVSFAYFLLQLAYTFFLKRVIILDVFAIAAGFVLRVAAGALVIDVKISSWLLICTSLLSLFLGLSKRRYELVALEDEAKKHRTVLSEYSPYLLDQMISVVTASTVVAYSLYTISEETIIKFGTENLVFTIPFILYGIFRYLYLIHVKIAGGSPEDILVTDKPLMINILLWVITIGVIIYG